MMFNSQLKRACHVFESEFGSRGYRSDGVCVQNTVLPFISFYLIFSSVFQLWFLFLFFCFVCF